MLYHFDNTKFKYSTSQKILPKFWNPEKQPAKETRTFPESANFNFLLNKLETSVNNAYRSILLKDMVPTPALLREVMDEVLNKRADSRDLIAFATSLVKASDRKASTKRAIGQTIAKLKDFQLAIKRPIQFDSVDLNFYNDFINFLIKKDLMQSTIGSHIKNVKLFMREAFERNLTANVQFQSKRFKKPFEESESIYLTTDEITKLNTHDLTANPKLERVRDLFIVACYTGLRYSDLTQLDIESVSQNKKVIKLKTQKTSEVVVIPINSIVNTIIEKYNGHLPTAISNHKMNEYLKDIAKLAKMDESVVRVATKGGIRVKTTYKKHDLITVHTARRSFATNAYLQNVPSISIMKITGHRTERNFLKYIKISQEDNANKLTEHPFFV